jgi:hypothetical protein
VKGAGQGDAYDWRGAHVVDRWHGFTVLGDSPARALVIVGPPRLDGQVAATGTRLPGPT